MMRIWSPKSFIKRLGSDSQAIAAVEFALVAPIFVFMTTAAIDLGYVQLAKTQLHGATLVAARSVIQTKTATSAQRKASVETQLAAAMASFPKVTSQSMSVVIRKYSNFDRLNPEPFTDANSNGKWDVGEAFTDLNANATWDRDTGTLNDLGSVGDVVKIEVTYPLKPLFSYSTALFGINGRIDIAATGVFRNEPD